MKDFFGQSRADHRKDVRSVRNGRRLSFMDKNRKKPRSIIPGGIRGKLSGKGSCRAGGVSRMREAEEELLSLEREDRAFSSLPRPTQDSDAGKAPPSAAQPFYEKRRTSRRDRTRGADGRRGTYIKRCRGSKTVRKHRHIPGISSGKIIRRRGIALAPYGRQRNN